MFKFNGKVDTQSTISNEFQSLSNDINRNTSLQQQQTVYYYDINQIGINLILLFFYKAIIYLYLIKNSTNLDFPHTNNNNYCIFIEPTKESQVNTINNLIIKSIIVL